MDFERLREIDDELERIARTYDIFNEDARLNRSQAARVEFLTTVRSVEKYLQPDSRILDIGAGAGEYSLFFAKRGHEVSAVELADNNIRAFRNKLTPDLPIDLRQGNAMDLSCFQDESFDIVLLFGPLYHLLSEADRQQCIAEARRVCRADGTLFFSFISNDMVFATEFVYDQNYFENGAYDRTTFKQENFPFVFFTVDECREMLKRGQIRILQEVASDGLSELLAERINRMDEPNYRQYLNYHFYCCEKPEMLGHSNHLLFAGKK